MGIIKIECPSCHQHYSVDVLLIGKKAECSTCGSNFTVGTKNVISWNAKQQEPLFTQAQQARPRYSQSPAQYNQPPMQKAFVPVTESGKSRNTFASLQNDKVMCSYENKLYSKKDILEIAKNQKRFIFFILIFFVFQFFTKAMWNSVAGIDPSLAFIFRFLLILGALCFFVAEAFFCIKMMLALQTNTALTVMLAIFSFLPLIGIFIALALNSNANKVLAAAGLDVGFLGVSGFTIKQLQNQ